MINELFDLSGKVALVTGGTHGIGMACGKMLAKAGAKLCVNDIDDAKLASCKEEYKKEGIDVYTVNFNVCSVEGVDKGISQIEKEVGPIDILVNNAGIIKRIPILEMTVAEYEQVRITSYNVCYTKLLRIAPHLNRSGRARVIVVVVRRNRKINRIGPGRAAAEVAEQQVVV